MTAEASVTSFMISSSGMEDAGNITAEVNIIVEKADEHASCS